MLQRDYVLELIGQFTEVVKRALKLAQAGDLGGCEEVERQIGEILDLDYSTALSLAPDSLVTMMVISGMGDSVASYVCFALAGTPSADASRRGRSRAWRRSMGRWATRTSRCFARHRPRRSRSRSVAIPTMFLRNSSSL